MQEAKETGTREECTHENLEFLGEDSGRNVYLQCKDCGSVIVDTFFRRWVIAPVR